ncbi:MAG: hypothetical protein K2G03_03875 [Bacilli bacterium]|nr:hypothetical protein [Bacilli bacterium]
METLVTILPIIIDILLIFLLVIGIILLIKCIRIIDKARDLLQNVEDKVNSLNALFSVVEMFNSKIALLTDKVTSTIESFIARIFNRKNKDEYDEEYELENIIKKEGNE